VEDLGFPQGLILPVPNEIGKISGLIKAFGFFLRAKKT
jgi:hypothetical protein